MKIFVSKSDRVEVEVYAFETDKGVDAAVDEKDVPTGVQFKKLKFFFQKPTYEDSRSILSNSTSGLEVNPMSLQNSLIKILLKEWDLTDENDKAIECSSKNISSLSPTIVRAAAAGLLTKVQI